MRWWVLQYEMCTCKYKILWSVPISQPLFYLCGTDYSAVFNFCFGFSLCLWRIEQCFCAVEAWILRGTITRIKVIIVVFTKLIRRTSARKYLGLVFIIFDIQIFFSNARFNWYFFYWVQYQIIWMSYLRISVFFFFLLLLGLNYLKNICIHSYNHNKYKFAN